MVKDNEKNVIEMAIKLYTFHYIYTIRIKNNK
jgi:hypothetical protein